MSDVERALQVLRRACASDFEAVVAVFDRRRATALAQVLREPTAMERARELCSIGWTMPEIEFLVRELKPGETIRSFDVWGVTTNERVIDRAELREKYRPASWTRVDKWHAQFPRLPQRN